MIEGTESRQEVAVRSNLVISIVRNEESAAGQKVHVLIGFTMARPAATGTEQTCPG